MIESAYKYHITDSTRLHIERSQLAFEIAIMDKQVFLSRFLSEIIPRIQDRGEHSKIQQQSPVQPVSEVTKVVCTSEGQWETAERSNLHDADITAILASLSYLSTINRYYLPNNIEGQRVYIPETVTVASSSSASQTSRNRHIIPVPDPICSTRIAPVIA